MKNSISVSIFLLSFSLLSACGGGVAGGVNRSGGGGDPQLVVTHFSVAAPATANAGTSIPFTVTALSASNSTITGYPGTVHFTSTDTQATLPADSTLTGGTGTFSATLNTAGKWTIAATDTAAPSITGVSTSINVSGTQGLQINITSGAPPDGTVGVEYDNRLGQKCTPGSSPMCVCIILGPIGEVCRIHLLGFQLEAAGGMPPYSWTWEAAADSSLPLGLSLDSRGLISGTPTSPGSYGVVVTVTDSETLQAQASAEYSMVIETPTESEINAANLPSTGLNRTFGFHSYNIRRFATANLEMKRE